jgi:hypothetical protein
VSSLSPPPLCRQHHHRYYLLASRLEASFCSLPLLARSSCWLLLVVVSRSSSTPSQRRRATFGHSISKGSHRGTRLLGGLSWGFKFLTQNAHASKGRGMPKGVQRRSHDDGAGSDHGRSSYRDCNATQLGRQGSRCSIFIRNIRRVLRNVRRTARLDGHAMATSRKSGRQATQCFISISIVGGAVVDRQDALPGL